MKINYLTKHANCVSTNYGFRFSKPAVCPRCGCGTDAPYIAKQSFSYNGHVLLFFVCKCTACQKDFCFASEQDGNNVGPCIAIAPSITADIYENKVLSSVSERFIDIYNQALKAEFDGSFELAAIGFRSALEVLIKDYAINELHIPKEEVVKKDLFNSISEYLHQEELINTADVIRILGNDFTHYERKYPEHDFALLKGYMDIFLKQVEVLYMIKHPPVSRP